MPKTPGYEYRCDSNPLIFQGTYILSYIAAFFTTLLVEQIEQITYAYTYIRKELSLTKHLLHHYTVYALHFTICHLYL